MKKILQKEKLSFEPAATPEIINEVREKIYDHLIVYVDANDNGIENVKDKQVNGMPTTLWDKVGKTNPMWWDESP